MSQAEVNEIADKAVLDVPGRSRSTSSTVAGTVKGSGPLTAVIDNGSNSLVTLRYRLKDVKFEAIEKAFKSGDIDLPAGSFLVESSPRVRSEIEKLGLQAVALAKRPTFPGTCSTCRASPCSAPGAAPRMSAGCATPSIISKSRTT